MLKIVPEGKEEKLKIEFIIKEGKPFVEIIKAAKDLNIDMIVIAAHGRSGLNHALFGSTAEEVVRKSPCPVLSIKHPQHEFVMP